MDDLDSCAAKGPPHLHSTANNLGMPQRSSSPHNCKQQCPNTVKAILLYSSHCSLFYINLERGLVSLGKLPGDFEEAPNTTPLKGKSYIKT